MKKKIISAILVVALVVATAATTAWATGNLEEIMAYLNHGVSIEFHGEQQQFADVDGNAVYPITYKGTTYLPVRGISNLFGIPVDWDGANNKVLLGRKTTDPIDLTATARGSSRYYYISSDPDEIGDHTTCVALKSNTQWAGSWPNVDRKGYGVNAKAYNDVVRFDVSGIKQISFTLAPHVYGAEATFMVYAANSKDTINKGELAYTQIMSMNPSYKNGEVAKTINIDCSKYDTIMFNIDGWMELESGYNAPAIYVYDLVGIPA